MSVLLHIYLPAWRGHQITLSWLWLLEIELMTWGRAASAFNHWVISPAPVVDFLRFLFWNCTDGFFVFSYYVVCESSPVCVYVCGVPELTFWVFSSVNTLFTEVELLVEPRACHLGYSSQLVYSVDPCLPPFLVPDHHAHHLVFTRILGI